MNLKKPILVDGNQKNNWTITFDNMFGSKSIPIDIPRVSEETRPTNMTFKMRNYPSSCEEILHTANNIKENWK